MLMANSPLHRFLVGSLGALRRASGITVVLVFMLLGLLMLGILVTVDYFLAADLFYEGLFVLLGFVLLFVLLQWALGPELVLLAAGPHVELREQDNPLLFEIVTRLSAKSGLARPRIFVVQDARPNAFVFGRTRKGARLAVTSSILEALNREELEGVLGHELGHIRHGDVTTMTFVSAVPLFAYILARVGLEFLRVGGRGGNGKGKAAAIIVAGLVALLSYLVYLLSQLLVLYLSRTREYYADAYSAALTERPWALRSALAKLAYGLSVASRGKEPVGLRAFYAADPVKARRDATELREKMARFDLDRDGQFDEQELKLAMGEEARSSWRRANEVFSTHPAIYKRLLMLEQMEEEIVRSGALRGNLYKYV